VNSPDEPRPSPLSDAWTKLASLDVRDAASFWLLVILLLITINLMVLEAIILYRIVASFV
jgi:hypothetical protein